MLPVALVAALLAIPRPAAAAWALDGNPLCRARTSQGALTLCPDGAGGVIAAWTDPRGVAGAGANINLYGQHLAASGVRVAGWTPNGDSITVVACFRYVVSMVPDGSGGALLAWHENRCTTNLDVYAARINGSGAPVAGWIANGTPVCTLAADQRSPVIAGDGAGGAFIAWEDLRNGIISVYAQHLTGSGAIAAGWSANGLKICSVNSTQQAPSIAPDGGGGVFIAWQDDRSGSGIFLTRITGGGSVQAGWDPAGLAVSTASAPARSPGLVADGAGGALLVWTDRRGGTDDVYAQRISGAGAVASGWTTGGTAVSTAAGDQQFPVIAADGSGGAFFAWQDHRGADFDIDAQHLGAGAAPAWTAEGIALCTAAGDQTSSQIVADGAGGLLAAWLDARSGPGHVYGQHVDASGAVHAGWSAGGVAICTASGSQQAPRLIEDGAGGAIAGWLDSRSCDTTATDVYALRIPAGGPAPAQVTNLGATHHHGQTFLTWTSPSGPDWTYRVYSSAAPITSASDLAGATLLGAVGDSTWYDRRLSVLTGTPYPYAIDSLVLLTPSQGLFVFTPSTSGARYYAVTVELGDCSENRAITTGGNALSSPVAEQVGTPEPVFQRTVSRNGLPPAQIYTLWTTDQATASFAAMANRPGQAFDCAVIPGSSNPAGALMISLHARGGDFLSSAAPITGTPGEWILALDDPMPTLDVDTYWYGFQENYDPATWTNPVPTSGMVRDYTMQRMIHTLLWARRHFVVDTTRVYAYGISMGGIGEELLALRRPDLIAGVMDLVAKFDFSFLDDPNPCSAFNTSGGLRGSADRLWGKVSTDLPSSEGRPIYDALNDGVMVAAQRALSLPPLLAFNGKNDCTVGWAEKLPFYRAVHDAREAAYFFWDPRDHLSSAYAAWTPMQDPSYLYRFRTDRSFPALTNCSADANPGDGTPASGDSVGCINGYVEWDSTLTDQVLDWRTVLRTRNLTERWGTAYGPESLTVDVTPRRLQHLMIQPGVGCRYDLVRLSDGDTVRAGTVVADSLGLITVPAVIVYRNGSALHLHSLQTAAVRNGTPPSLRLGIRLGANPARPACTVGVIWPYAAPAHLELEDVTGRIVARLVEHRVQAGTLRVPLPAALPVGVYFLQARQEGLSAVARIVVLR